jgi:hypothetical protein
MSHVWHVEARKISVVLVALDLSGNYAIGQLASGTINGTVSDAQGAAIAEAAVYVMITDRVIFAPGCTPKFRSLYSPDEDRFLRV